MSKVYIVAEIGCNHNGSVDLAKRMVDAACKCGVDAVKFQTFNSNLLISKFAPKADYQKKNTGEIESQLEMTKKLELSHNDYIFLRDYAKSIGLDVFSTGFDLESNDFLYSSGQNIWKIPSGEITNLPYLEQIANYNQQNKKVIMSTGMSTLEEIHQAVNIIVAGSKTQLILLHCNTEYPTEDVDVNVSAIETLKREFPNYEIGFSDHSRGTIAPIMAISFGARFIEKHFTLDKNMSGPDHKASVDPKELAELCKNVRRAEILLGSGNKVVTASESKNKIVARKSIVAKLPIKAGEIFTDENVTCKRPGNGISPMHWYDLLGTISENDYAEDELIRSSLFPNQM